MPTKTAQPNTSTERPPVIVITGHIDHGKSTLLDYIRKTSIVAGEAGGITQSISAYEITHTTDSGEKKKITFLDTPGHEAFSHMRIRGARVADIGVLIVSAEDGVKAQTVESIKALKAAKIPFIVAANKIDRPNANIEKIKQELAGHDVFVEGFGGTVPFVSISAKTGQGVPELLDMMLLVAELEELSGDPEIAASGMIVEAHRDPKRGVSATLIITDGTLKKGMFIVAEHSLTSVRRIDDFMGVEVETATFSSPIQLSGFDAIPPAGALFTSYANKKEAEAKARESIAPQGSSGNSAAQRDKNANVPGKVLVPLVIKADALGTLEAVEEVVSKLENERVAIKIIHKGVGAISESDIKLAAGGEEGSSIVVGFNAKIENTAKESAERLGVVINTFDIIYKLSEWLEAETKLRIPKITVPETIGKAKIQRLFSHTKDKQIIGGKVLEGKLVLGENLRVMRRDFEIGKGRLIELQSQKVKTKEVEEGMEFGALVESKYEIMPGDIIEIFSFVER